MITKIQALPWLQSERDFLEDLRWLDRQTILDTRPDRRDLYLCETHEDRSKLMEEIKECLAAISAAAPST